MKANPKINPRTNALSVRSSWSSFLGLAKFGPASRTWSGSRDEFVPRFHSGGREEIGGRGRRGAIVNACLTGYDFVTEGGHLSSDDSGRSAAGVGDESRLVVAKDKLPSDREGLQLEY